MVETIEVEVTPTVAEMLEELKEHHGETLVRSDLTKSVQESIRQGYQQLPEN